MTNLVKKLYHITVWYRYVVHGEQEKDFDILEIEADTPQIAVNKAADIFNSYKEIPFQFICEGKNYNPTNFTKEDLFNLTNPDYEYNRNFR